MTELSLWREKKNGVVTDGECGVKRMFSIWLLACFLKIRFALTCFGANGNSKRIGVMPIGISMEWGRT